MSPELLRAAHPANPRTGRPATLTAARNSEPDEQIFARLEIFSRGGYEELGQAQTSRGASGDLFGRNLDHLVEHTVGGVAPHRCATVECHPDAAREKNKRGKYS
jgi:hypothetical protein